MNDIAVIGLGKDDNRSRVWQPTGAYEVMFQLTDAVNVVHVRLLGSVHEEILHIDPPYDHWTAVDDRFEIQSVGSSTQCLIREAGNDPDNQESSNG